MFRSKTIFVVGAGASKEVGFPVGSEMANEIADLLCFERYRGRLQKGNREFYNNFSRTMIGDNTLDHHLKAASQISKGLDLAKSIDNYIEAHQHNPRISLCAKAAILHIILKEENKSPLYIDAANPRSSMNHRNLENTWYVQFAKILFEQVTLEKLDSMFKNISIVCFNYDRCIQQFLISAVTSYFSVQDEHARRLVESLKIFHPYGSVGNLFEANQTGLIKYGRQPSEIDIVNVCKSIKTYTERIEESELVDSVRLEVSKAETVVFLGFGFHPQNIKLLTSENRSRVQQVFATALGISVPDISVIEGQIRSIFNQANGPRITVNVRNDLSCVELFSEYQRTLASS